MLRAAARAIQIFTVFIFEYGASIRNIRKFAPFENFLLYGTSLNIKLKQHWKITIFWFRTSFVIKAPTLPQNELVYTTIALGDLSTVKFDGPGRNREKQGETGRNREKQGETGRNREKQGETGRNREKQGEKGRNREKQGETGRNREKQVETGRNREKQGETGRNREKQGETGRNR